ncbi:uncharacterized protein EDB91DRAFT_1255848 [Suillus paluster]|uniref:uncharacterized protein n=1 Tax=Suillus paluster TaxID=48578 RepID=UPI001B86CF66|nr:uncharacterized protein EDB91DRAFT_1255848 [Suillus paluster]KAG1722933.1 hypothetical protein EDB91DRAFT_1255848 [Suillus paluster]
MFYDMGLYNPKNKKAGFLCGHVIVQGWHHIFTGPISALSKDRTHRSSKPTKGKMHNLTEPGPINIMYAAIQMYFVACNAESWMSEVGSMNLEEMYYTAVNILLRDHAEDHEAPGLTQNLSKHWRVALNSASNSEDDMDDFFGDDNVEPSMGGPTRDHESAASGPTGGNASTSGSRPSSTGGASASAVHAVITAGGMLEGGNRTNTGDIDSENEGPSSIGGASTAGQLEGRNRNGNLDNEDEEEQQPQRRHRLGHDHDIQRECSLLTTPPTSPAPPSPVRQPAPSRGRGRGRRGKRGKH